MNNICKFPRLSFFCLKTAGLPPPSIWEDVVSLVKRLTGSLSLCSPRSRLIRYDDPTKIHPETDDPEFLCRGSTQDHSLPLPFNLQINRWKQCGFQLNVCDTQCKGNKTIYLNSSVSWCPAVSAPFQ